MLPLSAAGRPKFILWSEDGARAGRGCPKWCSASETVKSETETSDSCCALPSEHPLLPPERALNDSLSSACGSKDSMAFGGQKGPQAERKLPSSSSPRPSFARFARMLYASEPSGVNGDTCSYPCKKFLARGQVAKTWSWYRVPEAIQQLRLALPT